MSDLNLNTKINLIWAQAHNRVIGFRGAMPWHLPEDLAHFKRMTLGAPVIMGRKTWESLPSKFRPLPGRMNIVISRQKEWLKTAFPQSVSGVQGVLSLQAALDIVAEYESAWVIGGAQIYAQALQFADRAVVTEIDASFEGDAFAPKLDNNWTEIARESHIASSGLPYTFSTYQHQHTKE